MRSTDYAAVVYDLDGTLIDLAVDWRAARRDVAAVLREDGLDVDGTATLWDCFDLAEETGHVESVEAELAVHEGEGATASTALALVDGLPHQVPVGVCSLNGEDACFAALERHGIDEFVDVVVGRDSHAERKPHPGPLLATIEALGVESDRTLFVGNSERDAVTAERAGVDFRWIDEAETRL